MKIKKQTVVISVIAVLIFAFIIIKNLPSEKKKVVRDIKVLAQNVEQEYWAAMVPYLDPAYADPKGLTYQALPLLFGGLFQEVDSIEVWLSRIKPRIDSTRGPVVFASCSLDVKVIARAAGDPVLIYGEVIKPSPVRAYLKKFGDRYRVYSADY